MNSPTLPVTTVCIDVILSGTPAKVLEPPPPLGGSHSWNNTTRALVPFPLSIPSPHEPSTLQCIAHPPHLMNVSRVLGCSLGAQSHLFTVVQLPVRRSPALDQLPGPQFTVHYFRFSYFDFFVHGSRVTLLCAAKNRWIYSNA